MSCGPDCRFCLSHDERAIRTLRRDVDAYRLVTQCALTALADQARALARLREQLAAAQDELRRYTQAAVTDSPTSH